MSTVTETTTDTTTSTVGNGDANSTPATSMDEEVADSLSPTAAKTLDAEDVTIPTESLIPPRYPEPPAVKEPYTHDIALEDLPGVSYALETFLASKMFESEEYCHESDPPKERMYFATGYGLIQCVKGLMSFEDEDLLAAIGHTKHGNHVATLHRKKASMFRYVSGGTHTTAWIKHMTPMEQHAELTYAESLIEKAILGIVYSGDWLAFIKEALNMRTTFNVYRQLGKFIEEADANGEDPSIDAHFRSGVYLGCGLTHVILSLIPSKLYAFVELFGYRGDRALGLAYLQKAGGWTKDKDEPAIDSAQEGVRRTICDMALLIFHLVMSSFTFDGIDVGMAQKILDWNLRRYPSGVFFLFGAGRLALMRSQPRRAIAYYNAAMEAQKQYRNLHHISFWEIAISNLALWDIGESMKCWRTLEEEATWSKATYTYALAVCLFELGGEDNKAEAIKLMKRVPGLRQRIAGKSIPLEKFTARKAKKFESQGGRLALPGLEMTYLWLGIAHAPRSVITERMTPMVDKQLAALKQFEGREKEYEKGMGYWDDFALAKMLEGVCWRYLAYPDPDAILDPSEKVDTSKDDAVKHARAAFDKVFEVGPKIEYDHHLVYMSHYELGRLLACIGDQDAAKHQFDLVLSGKPLEVSGAGRKGKYSLESSVHMRTHAAVDALHQKRL